MAKNKQSIWGRIYFWINLRIMSFFQKLIGNEPHVSWKCLFLEHFIDYPKLKFLGKTEQIAFEEIPFSEKIKIVRVSEYDIFWPADVASSAVVTSFNSFRRNESDNYFRFYFPKNDDIVFDLGACEGFFSLRLSGKVKKVYALEPFANLCECLSMTLASDVSRGAAEVCNYAVSNKSGAKNFFVDAGLDGSTAEISRLKNIDNVNMVTVQSITIDDFVERYRVKYVSMIKMDIEGSEYDALCGAERTLNRYKPDLLISAYHYPRDYERLCAYVEEKGYEVTAGPITMTDQCGQGRPWYRYALIYATHSEKKRCKQPV